MAGEIRNIDLHMHTTVSDGTDTPEEILLCVKKAGIDLFSVTDHDSLEGCRRIKSILSADSPDFICGAEFSCRDEEGKYHILGYGCDLDAEAINALVAQGHAFRMEKVLARLDFLEKRFGFSFPQEEVDWLFSLANPGKPHIGIMMARLGYAKNKEEAITEYINQIHFKNKYVRPEDAIRAILDSGGIPVLAHPPYGSGDQLILGGELKLRVEKLMSYGLKGLETFYSEFTDKLRNGVLALAEAKGLYVTAGSDYHGKNKLVALGETGLSNTEDMPEGLNAFLKDVKKRR